MKKYWTAVAMASALVVGVCGCGGDGDPVSDDGATEGIYRPEAKISTIFYDDREKPNEIWLWDADTLMSLNADDMCGGYTETVSFRYDEQGRVDRVVDDGGSTTTRFAYDGGRVARVEVSREGDPVATVTPRRDGSHRPVGADVTVSDELVGSLVEQMMGALQGDASASRSLPKGASKMSISRKDVTVDLEWTGSNVTRIVLRADVSLSMTLGELPEQMVLGMLTGMGLSESIASTMMAAYGNTALPIDAQLSDTIDYTYDSHPNPLLGFMGRLGVETLSAANMTRSASHGTVHISTSVSVPMLGNYPVDRTVPLPAEVKEYSYGYNADGFPETVTSSAEGESHEIEYLAQ